MKAFIGGHQVVTDDDFLELSLGTPLELWLGVDGESREERAARLDAARDILADQPELLDTIARVAAEVAEMAGAYAPTRLTTARRGVRAAARARQNTAGDRTEVAA
ncbi:hypothetical protein [Streptomyces sp. NPDC037389]|uniref:hypothetical protein n=1 Tax=Streptomyces sp. NPDC037389 TaxID=3155369 RepID=UPI0033FE7DC0